MSLELLGAAGVTPATSVIDVGGGDSPLVDALLQRGHQSVAVLDVAHAALGASQERLGTQAAAVTWLEEDLLTWKPERAWDVWHDRAVFHFLTQQADRDRYREALMAATTRAATVIVGTFAADGPQSCSGLSTARYDPDALAAEFRFAFEPVAARRELHTTPSGGVQPFSWLTLRRR